MPAERAEHIVEYLARIEYEAQMKCADVGDFPWAGVSETHREIARAGIRAVLKALGISEGKQWIEGQIDGG